MFRKKVNVVMGVAAMGVAMTTGIGFAAEKGTVTADSLNIRSGPSTSYSITAKAKKGTVLNIMSKKNGWYEVSLSNGQTGWASGSYIEVAEARVQQGEIIKGDTYLRASANWSSEKLVLLKVGVKVSVISSDANWTKVEYNGKTGYVSNDYVKVSSISGSTSGSTNVSTSTGVIQGATYLRASANWSSEKLVLLEKGITVKVISSDANWTKVEYNGKTGYVSNDYVKVSGTSGSTSGSTNVSTSKKLGVIVTDSLNVRKGPSTNYEIVTKVSRWQQVTIIDESNGWYKIETPNGIVGWASGSYIDLVSSSQSGTGVSSKIDAVIKLAKAQLGKAYEWGAEGPNTFDCSGLVWYVYKNAVGIELPRVSRDQAKYGTAVSRENIQIGDLVAFDGDQNGTVEHIGIYIGNGEFIHSPRTGDVVKITSMSSSYYKKGLVAIRRIIQ